MSKLYACITIDTEPDCDVNWQKKDPMTFRSVTHGIPNLLRPIFKRHQVNPVYFVAPSVVSSPESIAILKQEIDNGAEIGTHLHGEEFDSKDIHQKMFACSDYTNEEEFKRIKKLDEIIRQNLNVKPISYRAGRFGCDSDTIQSLEKLGYKVDSSVTPGIDWSLKGGPDFKGAPYQPYFINSKGSSIIKQSNNSNILEIPITIGGKRLPFLPEKWFFYKWLRPSFMFNFELKSLVRLFMQQYKQNDIIVLCIMFHSVELIPKASPYVRTNIGQKIYINRLNTLLEYLKQKGFEFCTLKEVYKQYLKIFPKYSQKEKLI